MTVVEESPAPGVRTLLLDRPTERNAIDLPTVDALRAAVADAAAAPGVRAVVLGSTTPGVFCAGADLHVSPQDRAEISERLYRLYADLLRLRVPVIAAIDGAAVGGGAQFVVAADVRLASSRARVKFVGTGHGISVGPWGLPALVGRGKAMDLVLSERFVTADEAVAMGLFDRVVVDPLAAALELAQAVVGRDADAVARAKAQVLAAGGLLERLEEERVANVAVFTGHVPTHLRPRS